MTLTRRDSLLKAPFLSKSSPLAHHQTEGQGADKSLEMSKNAVYETFL